MLKKEGKEVYPFSRLASHYPNSWFNNWLIFLFGFWESISLAMSVILYPNFLSFIKG
ncbi:DUF2316 family protein [Streptococcus agalactiae]|nr:DUF2316 family protein [Streptococcus agalactiae]